MKFLFDVCASSRALRPLLTDLGHDVLSPLKEIPARRMKRCLPHPCLIRSVDMQNEERVAAMRELLERHADAMRDGAVIVVSRERVRIRLEARDRGGRGRAQSALRRRSRGGGH